nr:copia protein [Tanacetum cinerariifolium]
MAIEESKDLTSLSLDELIGNLKVHEMIIKKDFEIVKAKVERKYLALKAKGRLVRQPRKHKKTFQRSHDDKNDKNQRAFVGGSWSDSDEEDDEKVKNETCLVAQASGEIITKNKRFKATRNSLEKELSILKEKVSTFEKNKGFDLECVKCHMLKDENEKLKEKALKLTKFEKSTHCLNEMLSNQKPFDDKLGLGFNSFKPSSGGTKEIKFMKAQKKASSDRDPINMCGPLCMQAALEEIMGSPPIVAPGSEKNLKPDEWIKNSGCSKHMTGNQKLFSSYKAYNGGNVIFGRNLRGNIIGKGQICDDKCRVTFSEHNSEITKDGKVIVAQGYNQQEGIDYDETYAPVAKLESIRILLAYARALDIKLFLMDVKSAFLNGFINEESLDLLSISVPSKGRYKTIPCSPNVVKSFIQIPRQGQVTRTKNKKTIVADKNGILTHEIRPHIKPWVDIICENAICLGGHKDHVSACLCHMLYCIETSTRYNLAFFILKIMKKTQNKPKELLPYGMLLTRLFKHVVSVFPELAIDHYLSHDRVMHPLAPHYERKTRSDHDKKRPCESNAISSSTTLNHPSSSHPLDDTIDVNDEKSFHSNSSSPSQNVSSSSNVVFRVRQNPPHESHNLNTYLSETINLQTQQRDAHREGLRSIRQALKNMMSGKR